jgi:NADH:ubiquinone oxidoreductase subunit D
MRDLLESLPGAILPDPRRQSDDPGVALEPPPALDMVIPAAEDEVRHLASDASLLQRHLVWNLPAFDPRHGMAIGLRCTLAGSTIVAARVRTGYLHRQLGTHMRGLSVPDAASALMQTSSWGGLATGIAMVRAAEPLLGHAPHPPALHALREQVTCFAALGHHLDTLANPRLGLSASLERTLRRMRDDALPIVCGLLLGTPFAQPYAAARDLDGEQGVLQRCAVAIEQQLQELRAQFLRETAVWRDVGVAKSTPMQVPAAVHTGIAPPTQACSMMRLWRRFFHAQHMAQLATVAHVVDQAHPRNARTPAISVGRARTANGFVHVLVELSPDRIVHHCHVQAPDAASVFWLERALEGTHLEDAAVVMHSFGIDVALLDA